MSIAARIEELCDAWCAASQGDGGRVVIGPGTDKHRLLANGIDYLSLDHEATRAALVGTTKTLLRPGRNTILSQDHFALWAWCAELIQGAEKAFHPREPQSRLLFSTTLHAALARPAQGMLGRQSAVPHHAQQLIIESHVALSYLSFPLLEGAVKRACSTFIAGDGQVVRDFKSPRKNGTFRVYGAGQQCSSLRDLLWLLREEVADAELKEDIDKLRGHIAKFDPALDPFDLIYRWRNESLHGTASHQTIGGTLLAMSLLVFITELRDDFELLRARAVAAVESSQTFGSQSPWSFYPP